MLEDFFTLETFIAICLGVLIVYDLKIDKSAKKLINTPLGMVVTLLFTLVVFIVLHPVIGILLVIYLWESLKDLSFSDNDDKKRTKIIKKLNEQEDDKLEEDIIDKMAPIKNKNKSKSPSYIPYYDGNYDSYP